MRHTSLYIFTFIILSGLSIHSPSELDLRYPGPLMTAQKSALTKLDSKVYQVDLKNEDKKETRLTVAKGSTTHLKSLEIILNILGTNEHRESSVTDSVEKLIIIKEGRVSFTIGNNHKLIGPGGVGLILPGTSYKLRNTGVAPVIYYVFEYQSKKQMDLGRGKKAGGSFILDWNEIEYKQHDKGGRRNFFDRPTAMCEDFEMHVTNLNEKTSSHNPHTHVVEEIILMVEGNISMHIDGIESKATAGDFAFVDSNIPHAPTNIGIGQSIYYAFQWK